jgi:DNA topoisomerase-3
MRLIITEKPSMGRDVAAVLGAARRGEGFIEGKDDIITWCVGHLVELDDPDSYDARLKQWRMETLPIIPESFKYHPSERTKDQFRVIKELLGRKDVESVVNAADAGREGELIFDLVYTLSGCKKPVQRLWISSLTHEAIIEGFNNLKPAESYKGLRDSAHARQQADWLVGMNATRAQTIRARQSGHDGVYSLGRVQTPTLALIVGRDHEISVFVPVNYYEVAADFKAQAGTYRGLWFNKEGTRFDRKESAEAIAARVKGKPGKIEKVEKKGTRERPPLLYDLTALQRAANARYAFSAAHTLEVAQTLYEKKFITYPRTSSRHLSRSVNDEIKGHVEAARLGPYVEFIEKILAQGNVKLTNRHVDDKKVTDHHAVIPTKQRINPQSLSADEKRVYDLVVRRFLAAFYPDAELERTTIITETEGERFITRGTVVLKAGWRAVDPPGRERRAETDEENTDAELPPVKAEESIETIHAEALEKQTKAPPRYTESSLLGAMETAGKKVEDEELRLAMKDSGLGTPATRAAIIETLLKREYVTREKKALVATEKGIALIKMLPSPLLKSAELTGQWEQKLSLMARGEYALSAFINEVKIIVGDLVTQIASASIERGTASPRVREIARPDGALDCPKCKLENRAGFLIERAGANGKFIVCALGREMCGFISDLPKNAKQRKAMLQTVCHVCKGAMRLRFPKDKTRKVSLICSRYPACQGVRWFNQENALDEPSAPAETGPECPACKTPTVKRGPASSGNYFWSCPQWRSDGSGCNSKPIWINSASR